MNYIINETKIILFLSNGKILSVNKTDRKYPSIVNTLNLPSDEVESELIKIVEKFEVDKIIEHTDKFDLVDGEVYFDNEKLPSTLAKKVKSIIEDGLPLVNFENFWKNLRENPSSNSVNQLINFLSYKELPITEDGYFLAYKGIRNDDYSGFGNVNTRVIKGVVNSTGQILNTVGSTIEVLRRDVDDNEYNHCSHGLHVGSLNYAQGYCDKVIVVKVNPKDVVSVPTDYNFQKCRVCKYEVLYSYTEEIKDSVVSKEGEYIDTEEQMTHKYMVTRIGNFLSIIREEEDVSKVTIRRIKGIFSPNYPSTLAITEALQSLGYYFDDKFVYLQ